MKARVIALYLPQFHPVPENDKYWGKGFTEWNNVAAARPLFKGHYEPRIPADLGFYDLRLPEVREQQAEYARAAGIEGFCYWHYWFGNGVEVLQRPLDEVVSSGKPNFPFCIGWANHDWSTKTWTKDKTVKKQDIFKMQYLGEKDNEDHFYRMLNAFKDRRYIKVEGKLLVLIYDLPNFLNFDSFKYQWNALAKENGLPGFYFVSYCSTLPQLSIKSLKKINNLEQFVSNTIDNQFQMGADAVNTVNLKYAELKSKGLIYKSVIGSLRKHNIEIALERYDYGKIIKHYYTDRDYDINVFPQILVGNDRSPRAGKNAIIYENATPENFYIGAKNAISYVINKDYDHRIIFVNSWNEWGEGSYMEPDRRYGTKFIEALNKALN